MTTTTMISYKLDWTDPDGTTHTAVASYDKPSAKHRQKELEADGCTAVTIRQVKPGEL
ncbi:hypothetical protein [Streptomyces spectabilis]|uniref:Uncharacterized protein n=1 Tax=Streptomyces spectabilis TaxID=68270 RepID=A0A7W8B331_STRST|nr:hypothetical protein [Streptomyces spectabilis]MBB5108260.1 hypothetical protein [Streptomyces spectabilis]MCI3901021.1 hypothetical protein [Streptomyces spectabilis]GGV45519.1 hypothetical protein GCM10010245_71210 [Streptomyces spectabilis]